MKKVLVICVLKELDEKFNWEKKRIDSLIICSIKSETRDELNIYVIICK